MNIKMAKEIWAERELMSVAGMDEEVINAAEFIIYESIRLVEMIGPIGGTSQDVEAMTELRETLTVGRG